MGRVHLKMASFPYLHVKPLPLHEKKLNMHKKCCILGVSHITRVDIFWLLKAVNLLTCTLKMTYLCASSLHKCSEEVSQNVPQIVKDLFLIHPKITQSKFDNKLGYTGKIWFFVSLVHIYVTLFTILAQTNFYMTRVTAIFFLKVTGQQFYSFVRSTYWFTYRQ